MTFTTRDKGMNMAWKFFDDPRVQDGLDHARYMALMEEQAAQSVDDLDDEAAHLVEYTQLNLHRSQRILRTYKMAPQLVTILDRITSPQLWLVVTEPWCGDSAQCLPYITVMAQSNPNITLRLVTRDDNLDIMDEFLTHGKRAIPRLAVFDAEGTQLLTWGPRPYAAQKVFDQAKAEDMDKPELLERLHLFYGRDRGKALEKEFIALLEDLTS
jgi:hypothetical protein